uniref:group II intron reverse transcriptase/maturase mat1 n=1 Tax=Euglena agilis TaxID=96764 RepID=UPI0023AAA45D|nr:group II intron reverse transcriptase/maturase mat1 [Euglena agilis]WCH63300.1 group II intron reverse transcriptase/maturase mat1 [Euglena agilis]
MNFYESYTHVTWNLPTNLLFKLQKRLFKAAYIRDKRKLIELQKLIFQSNCARLLAIRDVTQFCSNKTIAGIDGKVFLSFSEKFELNEYLKLNYNNWKTQSLKKVSIIKNKETTVYLKIPTISDRVWQTLVKFGIEPIHESLFHPSSYGFRSNITIYHVQKALIFNLSKNSFASQKRIVFLDMSNSFCSFDHNYLVKKIIAPRSIKLGIFRLLEKGFDLEFLDETLTIPTFSSLLSNILLDGIETFQYCIRYGYFILFFLRPEDNEGYLIKNLKMFIITLGLSLNKTKFMLFFAKKGFDFLGWNFKLTDKTTDGLFIFPSYVNYQSFLKRVKKIINNSNYGALTKVFKLYPIIRDWKIYHKYSSLLKYSYSLFFVKKRAFKVFNSESRQDFYSSKRLLAKCFKASQSFDNKILNFNFHINGSYNLGHLVYLDTTLNCYFCIHCGMNLF